MIGNSGDCRIILACLWGNILSHQGARREGNFFSFQFGVCQRHDSMLHTLRVFSGRSHQLARYSTKPPVAPAMSIEELRRKFNAPKNAVKVKKEISQPDRIIGRAFAEIEEENRYSILLSIFCLSFF